MTFEQTKGIATSGTPYIGASSVVPELGPSVAPKRRPQLEVNDLHVLVLPAPGENNRIKPWDGLADIFAPETCSRYILVCTPEQYAGVPEEARKLARHNLQGSSAYQYLVEFACGVHSKDVGEYNVVDQFKTELGLYQTRLGDNSVIDHSESPPPVISKLMMQVLEDQKAIRNELINFLPKDIGNKQKFRMAVAKQAAEISGDEDVLIFVGRTPGEFEDLAHVLGRDNTHTVSRIRICHPDPKVVSDRLEDLRLMKRDKKIVCDFEGVDFEKLEVVMGLVDHVFCLLPMAKAGSPSDSQESQLDKRIQEAWKNRERVDGHFVHIKGDPTSRGASTREWRTDKWGYISPEDLQLLHTSAANKHNTILSNAKTAAQNCAYSRLHGQRPLFVVKMDDAPDSSIVCGLTHSEYVVVANQYLEGNSLKHTKTS